MTLYPINSAIRVCLPTDKVLLTYEQMERLQEILDTKVSVANTIFSFQELVTRCLEKNSLFRPILVGSGAAYVMDETIQHRDIDCQFHLDISTDCCHMQDDLAAYARNAQDIVIEVLADCCGITPQEIREKYLTNFFYTIKDNHISMIGVNGIDFTFVCNAVLPSGEFIAGLPDSSTCRENAIRIDLGTADVFAEGCSLVDALADLKKHHIHIDSLHYSKLFKTCDYAFLRDHSYSPQDIRQMLSDFLQKLGIQEFANQLEKYKKHQGFAEQEVSTIISDLFIITSEKALLPLLFKLPSDHLKRFTMQMTDAKHADVLRVIADWLPQISKDRNNLSLLIQLLKVLSTHTKVTQLDPCIYLAFAKKVLSFQDEMIAMDLVSSEELITQITSYLSLYASSDIEPKYWFVNITSLFEFKGIIPNLLNTYLQEIAKRLEFCCLQAVPSVTAKMLHKQILALLQREETCHVWVKSPEGINLLLYWIEQSSARADLLLGLFYALSSNRSLKKNTNVLYLPILEKLKPFEENIFFDHEPLAEILCSAMRCYTVLDDVHRGRLLEFASRMLQQAVTENTNHKEADLTTILSFTQFARDQCHKISKDSSAIVIRYLWAAILALMHHRPEEMRREFDRMVSYANRVIGDLNPSSTARMVCAMLVYERHFELPPPECIEKIILMGRNHAHRDDDKMDIYEKYLALLIYGSNKLSVPERVVRIVRDGASYIYTDNITALVEIGTTSVDHAYAIIDNARIIPPSRPPLSSLIEIQQDLATHCEKFQLLAESERWSIMLPLFDLRLRCIGDRLDQLITTYHDSYSAEKLKEMKDLQFNCAHKWRSYIFLMSILPHAVAICPSIVIMHHNLLRNIGCCLHQKFVDIIPK